ncbi:hypothetical protein N3K66_001114 [Trichothecium roseum]|uniref:Uncharacterized protein n=1 Tax=Trichothecium roseum TaxID=47278 RepID=A0ACC0VDU0_9HYPO|nr:hypothetical protein N3K66_001114 [Trichothecium roseum]
MNPEIWSGPKKLQMCMPPPEKVYYNDPFSMCLVYPCHPPPPSPREERYAVEVVTRHKSVNGCSCSHCTKVPVLSALRSAIQAAAALKAASASARPPSPTIPRQQPWAVLTVNDSALFRDTTRYVSGTGLRVPGLYDSDRDAWVFEFPDVLFTSAAAGMAIDMSVSMHLPPDEHNSRSSGMPQAMACFRVQVEVPSCF